MAANTAAAASPQIEPGPRTFRRWWRFNLVGAIGIVVQFAALFLLKSVVHINYLAATALAVEAAVIHNFIWHEHYTWADRVRPSWRTSMPRLVRFNLTTGAVCILGNLALMKIMVGFGHLNFFVANLIAIASCAVANFLVSDEWVFARTRNCELFDTKGRGVSVSWLETKFRNQILGEEAE